MCYAADLTELLVMFVRDRDNAFHIDNTIGPAPRQSGLIGTSVRDLGKAVFNLCV